MTEPRRNGVARTMRGKIAVLGIALALLLLAVPGTGMAEEPPSASKEPSKWEFEAEPYGWVSANYGSVTVRGHTAQIAVTPSALWGLMEDGNAFGAAGYFSVGYDRFSVFADSMGGYAQESVNETIPTRFCTLSIRARDKITFAMTDFGIGYRLGRWSLPGRQRPLTLGVYAGTRWMYFGNQLNAKAGVVHGVQGSGTSVFESFAWADPLIGVRWSMPVLDSVSLGFRGDIGGFGASSKLIWGLVSDVRYWLPWTPYSIHPYLAAGYRVTAFERSSSPGSIQLQFRGPLAGMGFVF